MNHSNEIASPSPTCPPWRIALCITELDPGGAERQFVQLATGLDRNLFAPEVICLSGHGRLIEPLQAAGIPVTCLDACGRWDFGVVFRLWRHFRRSRPDLVQTFLFHANIVGRIAARLARIPVVVSGIRVAERRRWHLRVDRMTDRLVNRHVCVSRAVAEYSTQIGGLPAEKLVVIPNGVDAERFANAVPVDLREFDFSPDSRVVLFIGRLDPQKNPELLIDAFRPLASRYADARLLVVGQGPLENELRQRSADLGDRVRFAGHRDDVPRLLKASACLALPSRWEGMPNVLLEAMAAGTPVVAMAAEGVSEALEEGEFGTIVQDWDADVFSVGLRTCFENPKDAAAIAINSQHHVIKQFTISFSIERYQKLFLSLLSERAK